MHAPQTKICLFGGTFDPIHLGHTYIALAAKKVLALDKVIFLPCQQSPHKSEKKTVTSAHRLKMCQLATANLPWAEVHDFDLTAPAPSFSWRTAEHFNSLYPDTEIYWLMGSDQWNSLPRWERAEHFAALVNILVFHRGSPPRKLKGFQQQSLPGEHPASASAVRNDLLSSHTARWLHPKVANYIKENHLYAK